jgi:hypothetical protein
MESSKNWCLFPLDILTSLIFIYMLPLFAYAYACSDKENSFIWLNNRWMAADHFCFKETSAGYTPSAFTPELYVYFGAFVFFFNLFYFFNFI